jgi:hypothetical protein
LFDVVDDEDIDSISSTSLGAAVLAFNDGSNATLIAEGLSKLGRVVK